jgi:hypothetical protein
MRGVGLTKFHGWLRKKYVRLVSIISTSIFILTSPVLQFGYDCILQKKFFLHAKTFYRVANNENTPGHNYKWIYTPWIIEGDL